MTLVVTHTTVTNAAADATALVDGPAWDANHTLEGVVSPSQGGTGVANNDASTITISGSFGATFTLTAETSITLPTTGTLTSTANKLSDFAATTSAELKTVISDETGSGALVFANTPTLVTPVLGAATATSINKVAITAPAASATLTLIDGTVLTGPAASGTAMTLGNTETVTGVKTFGSAGAVGRLKVAGTTSGSTVLDATAVASGTLTLPAATDTLVGKATTDTLTNKTIDTAGPNTIKVNGNTLAASSGTATVTIPNSTDTLVGKSTTDVLANKTLGSVAIGNSGAQLDFTTSLYSDYAISFQPYTSPLNGVNLIVGKNGSSANLNQITLNSGNTGAGTGAFIQHDINGLLAWMIGNRSGAFGTGVAYDATTVFVSQNGWKWLTGAAGGATPLFTAGSIRIASDGTISSDSYSQLNGRLGTGFLVSSFANINFNSANNDNTLPITLPTGYTRYQILRITISHASASLTTATFGVFSSTGAGGSAIVASGTACTVSSTSENTANNTQSCTIALGASGGTASLNFSNLYFRTQTAVGSAATGDVAILYHVLP